MGGGGSKSCDLTTPMFKVKNCQNAGVEQNVEIFNGDDGVRWEPTYGQSHNIKDNQSKEFWCKDKCNRYNCQFEIAGKYAGWYENSQPNTYRWLIFKGGGAKLHYANPPYVEPNCNNVRRHLGEEVEDEDILLEEVMVVEGDVIGNDENLIIPQALLRGTATITENELN